MISLAHWFKSIVASLFWYSVVGRWRLKDAFNDLYEGQIRSQTFHQIWRNAFGDQYAEEVDPCSFLTLNDLSSLVKYLQLRKDDRLVDLACGRGGTGLWIARETGARLVGVDLAEVAVEKARLRIPDFGLEGRAEFRVGDFADTGLPAASFDGALSIDSLFLVADKPASVRETARILKPGARFALTTWEMDVAGGIQDYRPMLAEAGFEIEAYEQTPQWEERQRSVHEQVLANQETLVREMGKAAANVWFNFAKIELPRLHHMRRVFIVARKK
jgi:ubiquinone/menaquinone biosynthesis C-methylase UbiE